MVGGDEKGLGAFYFFFFLSLTPRVWFFEPRRSLRDGQINYFSSRRQQLHNLFQPLTFSRIERSDCYTQSLELQCPTNFLVLFSRCLRSLRSKINATRLDGHSPFSLLVSRRDRRCLQIQRCGGVDVERWKMALTLLLHFVDWGQN